MSDALKDAVQELFIAMTTRWIKSDGNLAIGVNRKRILELTNVSRDSLKELIKAVKENVENLGLEVVEYMYEGDLWYTIRSNYIAPSELSVEEEAVLSVIIELLENMKEPEAASVEISQISKRVVGGKYLGNTKFDRTLRHLEYLGYIKRKRKRIYYSPRTLIEFSEVARKHIAEESRKLIF